MRPAAGSLVLVALAWGSGCGSSGTTTSHTAAAPATASVGAPAGPVEASSGSARVVSARAGAVQATMRGGTHSPRVGRLWPFSFSVTRAGAPARATVSYQYLLAGQVVAHRSHYTFTGHFADTTFWPAAAAGYPLTLRAVVVAGSTTIYLDYPVQVRR